MSDTDTGPELRVGQYGVRTFRVSADGYLLPVTAGTGDTGSSSFNASWKDGTCIAACNAGHTHLVPDDGCSCGIYSFLSAEQVRRQYPGGYNLLAVVSLEGRAVEGERGWRSEAGRVVAIWTAHDGAWRPSELRRVTNQLKTNYPNIAFHENLDAMLEDYEGISQWGDYPAGDAETLDQNVIVPVVRPVRYLSLAIRPLQLALLAAVTFVAARYAPAESVQGHDWRTLLSNGMVAFHQGELHIAAHPLWVTAFGGTLLMPMMSLRHHRWRRALLTVLIGATHVLSLEAVCVVVALTAHSSVGWLDLLIGAVCVVGSVPLLVFMPGMFDRLEHELFMKTRRSWGLVQTGIRVGPTRPD